MADRKSLLSWLRDTLSDVNALAAEHRFEAKLDQEIHAAQEKVRQANEEASAARADMVLAAARLAELRPRLAELEDQVVRLLAARSTGKARVQAQKVAELAAQVREWEVRQSVAQQHEEEKKALAAFHESVIKRLRRQLGLRRASINIQRSQEALSLFGEPALTSQPAKDAEIVLPETPQEVLERLRERATAPRPKAPPRAAPAKKSPRSKSIKTVKSTKKVTRKTKGSEK